MRPLPSARGIAAGNCDNEKTNYQLV